MPRKKGSSLTQQLGTLVGLAGTPTARQPPRRRAAPPEIREPLPNAPSAPPGNRRRRRDRPT
jgi:hypothetical protein